MSVLLYSALSKALSATYLDFVSVYVTEGGVTSFKSNSWLIFWLSIGLTFSASSLVVRKLSRIKVKALSYPRISMEMGLAKIFIILALLLHALNILLTRRIALPATGIDRFNFWDIYAIPVQKIFGDLMLFVPLSCGILFTHGAVYNSRSAKRYGSIGFLSYICILVLEGQRFHGLLLGLSLALGSYVIAMKASNQPLLNVKKYTYLAIGIAALLALLVSEFQHRGLASYAGGTGGAILYRVLVLQGHTFWSAYQHYATEGPSGAFLELFDGLNYTMKQTATEQVLEGYEEKGINFATALPATLIMIAGITGVIVGSYFYGAIYGLIVVQLKRVVQRGEAFSAIFLTYAWQNIHTVYAQASLQPFINPTLWIAIVLYFLSRISINSITKNSMPLKAQAKY
ncbi:MAG: DUF6418 domain-containing protein [Solimonas sp.]